MSANRTRVCPYELFSHNLPNSVDSLYRIRYILLTHPAMSRGEEMEMGHVFRFTFNGRVGAAHCGGAPCAQWITELCADIIAGKYRRDVVWVPA